MIAAEVLGSVEMGIVLLAACVLIGPAVAERFRIPGLVGLIAVGMVLGPSVLEWLEPNGFVATIGAAGLLYLMFLAGIELDLNTFAANRTAALSFGLLTFVIPFTLSVLMASLWLGMDIRATALMGAMWASHTVVAYPEAKAAGLDRSRAVGVAVAATVITDVLALIVLAVAASGGSSATESTSGEATHSNGTVVPLWAGLVLVAVFCLVVLPRLTRWVFTHVFLTRTQRFMWLFGGMAGGAVVGLLGGIEGLVGAFLAGIGMNRAVPAKSELMERVEFVGNAMFVPAFLVAVGLSIDPRALVEPSTLAKAGVFTALVLVGKSVPAILCGRLFRYSGAETAIMATLTIGQAAATLAVARVGTATGLFEQDILDAAVVTVVVAVLVTSFGTRLAAKRIERPAEDGAALGEHVLVLAPPERTARPLAALVTAISAPDGGLVTPFTTTVDGTIEAPAERDLDAFDQALIQRGVDTDPVTRVGVSVSTAVLTLSRESRASLVVLPFDGVRFPLGLGHAAELDAICAGASAPCVAARLREGHWERIVTITGVRTDPGATTDVGLAAEIVARLAARYSDLPVVVLAPHERFAAPFASIERATVTTYRPRSGDALDLLQPADILVAPAHIVADAGLLARVRLQRALADVSVVAVGDGGRLQISLHRVRRPMIGAVGTSLR